MHSATRFLALTAPLTGLLLTLAVSATPHNKDISLSGFRKRQDDGSGVGAEDAGPDEINTEGTGPLRSAVDARSLYTAQPTATWYQIDIGSSDPAATFTSFQTTFPTTTPIPKPNDTNQYDSSNPWQVDHIFELQVIVEAFGAKATRPTGIATADWNAASSAVNSVGASNSAIASAVSNLENLVGIPSRPNGFKKQVFRQQLVGNGGPSEGNGASYFAFFGPAVQKYLAEHQRALMAGTVDNIGSQIQSAANGNSDIKSYFTSYASSKYQGCIDYLSTWSGKPTTRSTTTRTSTGTVVPVPVSTSAPVFKPCPTAPAGGWPDYGTCQGICGPANYQCVQYLASDPATWQCSCG